jgi:hypothetical protein
MVMHVIDRSKLRESETRGQRPLNRIIVLPFGWGPFDGQDRARLCRRRVDGFLGAARDRDRAGDVVIPRRARKIKAANRAAFLFYRLHDPVRSRVVVVLQAVQNG